MAVYSYHTFILPLIWKNDDRRMDTFEEFTRCFEENPCWERKDPEDENSFSSEDEPVQFYNEYQYFYPQVRNALYGYQGNVVKTFNFSRDAVQNKGHYYISKDGRTYDLLLNAIRLKIYNTGVALFVLEAENHGFDKDGRPQNTFADVKAINDYGRRITLPYIPEKPEYSSCADALEIVIPALGCSLRTAFRDFILRVNDTEEKKGAICLNYLCDFIKGILSYGSPFTFSSDTVKRKNQIHIRPAIDDRMFVACIVNDRETTDCMLGRNVSGEERKTYETDPSLSKSLYEFLFVDRAGSCTCQQEAMRQNLLRDHLYVRWLDEGSIYGVAAQSLVLLFNGGAEHLIGSFLTIYVKMACLCLAQRASLICLQREISEASVEAYRRKISAGTVTRLMDLQERFSAFESQLLFREVTPQEQGIELYAMFRSFFFIEQTVQNVKEQLQGLNEAADTDFNYDLNKFIYILTVIGGVFGVWGVMPSLADGKMPGFSEWVPLIVCGIICLGILISFRRRKRAWKDKRK